MHTPKSFSSLPPNYRFHLDLDMSKNKWVVFWITLIQLFLILFFFLILAVINIEITFNIWSSLSSIPLLVLVVVVHEWIHGLFFKMGTDQKVKYAFHGFAASASVPGVYFTKRHYMLVGIAPAIFLNLFLFLLCFVPSKEWSSLFFILLAIHFSSCSGDFFVFIRFLSLNENSLIEDTGIAMKVFVKIENTDPPSPHI